MEPLELAEVSLAQLIRDLATGRVSSERLVSVYLMRIAEIDQKLNAVIERNPDAEELAQQRDRERKAGKLRGPLHGVPILVKDNIATADKMATTAGSLALVGAKVRADAPVIAALRRSGAIILGKTNLSEWANFRSSHSVSGWSGRGGQTRNPYALDRSPSGSSSGTGAAIAASLAAAGIGTETDGSITSPSAAAALVGLKPTVGLISRTGIIPISHTQDTAGPMARSVQDVALLLNALVSADSADPATQVRGRKVARDYTAFLDPRGLKGKRIGIARKKFFGYSTATDKITEDAIQALKKAGAIIVDPADIPTAGAFDSAEFEVLLYEFKADLNAYLKTLAPGAPIRSLKDLIAFNESHKRTEMPYFGQEILLQAQAKGPLSEPAYKKALAQCRKQSREQGIDAVMDKYRLDALFAPTQGPIIPIDLVNGDTWSGSSATTPAAVAGYPHITVPGGFHRGLPVGVSFFGRAWSEPTLLKIAYAFEQATRHRKAPTYSPTADIPFNGKPG